MTSRAADRTAGFSLMEVLVSLAIASGTLAAFYAATGSAGLVQRRADGVAAASAIAFDLAGSLGAEIPLAPGARSGTAADGSKWAISISPVPALTIGGRAVPFRGLMQARISVSAPRGNGVAETVVYRLAAQP